MDNGITIEEKNILSSALTVYVCHLQTVFLAEEFGNPLETINTLNKATHDLRAQILINYNIPEIARGLIEICPSKEMLNKVMASIHDH